MKEEIKGFSLIELMIIIVIIGVLSALYIRGGTGVLKDTKKKIAETSTSSVRLAQLEYLSNNGNYYYTSSGCSSTTTQQIITNLLDYNKDLPEKDFYFCISGSPNSNTYKITAKNTTTDCQVMRDEKNKVTYSNC
mgnify:FL=1